MNTVPIERTPQRRGRKRELKTYLFKYEKPHMGESKSITITNKIRAYSLPHVMYLSSLHRKIYNIENFTIKLEV